MGVRLTERQIGTKWVITSPDVPELHISHANLETARRSVRPALELLHAMKERIEARQAVERIQKERMYA